MNSKLRATALLILILTWLTLAACSALAETPAVSGVSAASGESLLLPMETPTLNSETCVGCAQATLSALQTQEQSNTNVQAAATAQILRANAQATLDASAATLSVALTQEQSNANQIAAQVAATEAIVRANAQATLVAAQATQNIALTMDAIRQTQVQDSQRVTAEVATQNASGTATQQKNNFLAESTQTAVANQIATQTQAAVATSQWYTDQDRQRASERQNFFWMWCPPLLILAVAFVILLFFWRWMKIRETQQNLEMQAVAPLLPQTVNGANRPLIIEHEPRPSQNPQYPLAQPRDHVRKWLEEVKRKLNATPKDDDDNPAS
jgi:hypothetical protein